MKNQPKSALFDATPTTRRVFIKTVGAGGLTGALSMTLPTILTPSKAWGQTDTLPERPNILIILTDQQRFPCHWPSGWEMQNLPNWKRLTQNGITFTRMYCNSAMCSPSRSTLFTGLYPEQHGVKDTITESTKFQYNNLPLEMQNMARMLATAGYQVIYKGKWHLSKGQTSYDPTTEEVAAYGFNGWTPPDAGQDGAPENYGNRHDARFVDEAIEFLSSQTPEATAKQPFALIVSLVNPHDVIGYPRDYEEDYPNIAKIDLGITVPDTINEDLSSKPKVQEAVVQTSAAFLGALITPQQRKTYVNFYAYLQIKVDQELERLMAVMEQQKLINNTVIFRMADHGEMGLSHGNMRQKAFVMYEEALHVPLIVSNPLMFPQAVTSDSLASLIDVMPTLASLAKVPKPESWVFRGQNLTPIFTDPTRKVQDTILFTFDDQHAGNEMLSDPMPQPNHIQAIIQENWKYARYFDPNDPNHVEYEMYNLASDPTEVKNWAGSSEYADKEKDLRAKLDQVLEERLAPIEPPSLVKHWDKM